MSDDEPDDDPPQMMLKSKEQKYIITQYRWRAPALHDWLETFSTMHLASRWHADGRRTRGNWVRTRFLLPEPPVKEGRPVHGLPKNFYSQEWLNGLSDSDLKKMNIKPAVDLRVDSEILK